jgi:hypothetical protein
MRTLLEIWIAGALILMGYSMGFDDVCQRESRIQNPIAFLAWPAAMVAIASGWEAPEKENICD